VRCVLGRALDVPQAAVRSGRGRSPVVGPVGRRAAARTADGWAGEAFQARDRRATLGPRTTGSQRTTAVTKHRSWDAGLGRGDHVRPACRGCGPGWMATGDWPRRRRRGVLGPGGSADHPARHDAMAVGGPRPRSRRPGCSDPKQPPRHVPALRARPALPPSTQRPSPYVDHSCCAWPQRPFTPPDQQGESQRQRKTRTHQENSQPASNASSSASRGRVWRVVSMSRTVMHRSYVRRPVREPEVSVSPWSVERATCGRWRGARSGEVVRQLGFWRP
jgi:hypothetical protein